ncbi:hypothetical protein AA309_10160 [Microvirga vignae]|uniref:Uncharacterized protein n=1 Tax=Microvirga vignae TaxID=1225564 RepID=A0A0H1RDJ3_9HYPH|nr:hypothetical protein [Microvirga vignae]KLK93154.1 hypothetical protein AA309_10160 [Microvirga vignae]
MTLTLQPVQVATGAEEEDMLLFDRDQRLLAVLVQLSPENEVAPGQWYLEVGFGRLSELSHPTFADLSAVEDWVNQRSRVGRSRW